MNGIHLFAGAGGGILAERLLGWKTICAVEKDPYCQAVLLARQADGLLEYFPIWDECESFDGTLWRGKVDYIAAGFPCQPFSNAGKRKGKDDERNMWPETIRIIRESGAWAVILENVGGLLTNNYFGTILEDLEKAGFHTPRPKIIEAACMGAHIQRQRIWIVAHSDCELLSRLVQRCEKISKEAEKPNSICPTRIIWDGTQDGLPEPAVLGAGNGLAFRMDRTKAIGNGQFPRMVLKALGL